MTFFVNFEVLMVLSSECHDVVVVGGGPAGMTAALWCSQLDLKTLLIEREASLGGQLFSIHNRIVNYPGLSAENGSEFFRRFRHSIDDGKFTTILNASVKQIEPVEPLRLHVDTQKVVQSKYLILSTGLSRNRLNVPGEAEYGGKGVLASGVGEMAAVKGKRLTIVGGGDAALENALILKDVSASVAVVHRRGRFTAREEFLRPVEENSKIEKIMNSVVTRIEGDDRLRSLWIKDASGAERQLLTDLLLVRIGFRPNSEVLDGIADLDPKGYPVVDRYGRTTVRNIFAIGDLSDRTSPTIVSSAGMGAAAAKAIQADLNRPKY